MNGMSTMQRDSRVACLERGGGPSGLSGVVALSEVARWGMLGGV